MKRGGVAAWRHQLAPRHLLGTATLSASTRIWAEAPVLPESRRHRMLPWPGPWISRALQSHPLPWGH